MANYFCGGTFVLTCPLPYMPDSPPLGFIVALASIAVSWQYFEMNVQSLCELCICAAVSFRQLALL